MSTTTNLHLNLLGKLPTPIAKAWGRFLREKSDTAKLVQAHAVLTTFLQYSTGLVLSTYLRASSTQKVEDELIKFASKKPSNGDYVHLLDHMLKALQDQNNQFCSFIIDWWLKEDGKVKESSGHLRKLIEYRNKYTHHYTPTDKELKDDNSFFDLITKFLVGAKWLWGYQVFRCTSIKMKKKEGITASGMFYVGENTPIQKPVRLTTFLHEDIFYISHPKGTWFLEMYPFFYFDEEETLPHFYVWHSIKKHQVLLVCERESIPLYPAIGAKDHRWKNFLEERHDLEKEISNTSVDEVFVAKNFDYIGQKINDRFEVQAILGEGGAAIVYQVFDHFDEVDRALKLLRLEHIGSSQKERMKREYKKMRKLSHPNILPVVEYLTVQDQIAISMPIMSGSLKSKIGEYPQKKIEQWAKGLFDALKYLHEKGILHRDVKPSNILFDEQENVYLSDFGIAKSIHDSDLTHTGKQSGTPKYFAPEMHDNNIHTKETDYFALGLTLHELVVGKTVGSKGKIGDGITGAFGKFIRTLGAQNPKKRLEAHWPVKIDTLEQSVHAIMSSKEEEMHASSDPKVLLFLKQCETALQNESLWSNGKLDRKYKFDIPKHPYLQIDTATKRDSFHSLYQWCRKNLHSIDLEWIENKKRTREYAFFSGTPPLYVKIEEKGGLFRWKGVFLHRKIKASSEKNTSQVKMNRFERFCAQCQTMEIDEIKEAFANEYIESDQERHIFLYEARSWNHWGNYIGALILTKQGKLVFTRDDILDALKPILGRHYDQKGVKISGLMAYDVKIGAEYHKGYPMLEHTGEKGWYRFLGYTRAKVRSMNPMIEVPAGSFMMGALPGDDKASGDEKPQHKVMLTKSMLMSKYACTQELYEAIVGTNLSTFKGGRRPIQNVSWCDAVLFCNKLSEMEGLEPAYVLPDGLEEACRCQSTDYDEAIDELSKQVKWNQRANGYRLPTEAEWEYCARGGESHLYSGSNNIDEVAWYGGDDLGGATHAVGQKKANGFGLYDMSGNLCEWVWDSSRYDGYGDASSTVDPIYIDISNPERVFRGGCWNYPSSLTRVSFRDWLIASCRHSDLSFRFLRSDNTVIGSFDSSKGKKTQHPLVSDEVETHLLDSLNKERGVPKVEESASAPSDPKVLSFLKQCEGLLDDHVLWPYGKLRFAVELDRKHKVFIGEKSTRTAFQEFYQWAKKGLYSMEWAWNINVNNSTEIGFFSGMPPSEVHQLEWNDEFFRWKDVLLFRHVEQSQNELPSRSISQFEHFCARCETMEIDEIKEAFANEYIESDQERHIFLHKANQWKQWGNYIGGLILTELGQEVFTPNDIRGVLKQVLGRYYDQEGVKLSGLLTQDVKINSKYHNGYPMLESAGRGKYRFLGYT